LPITSTPEIAHVSRSGWDLCWFNHDIWSDNVLIESMHGLRCVNWQLIETVSGRAPGTCRCPVKW